ncbi:ABC transporter permease [Lachnotalea glycerini]|uniref:ABC transporter permease n=1 Tax=Lachnotalea glycerini TaxID=1763509 RepID=A0A371JBZ1_9FIRM|nr:ABC transporter permease [Lachnotalea glycerini]RDY30271.1 ABC transporter permease [Lachnotalea glycerini]
MFQNDNRKIVTQLAKSSIKADKKRNFFIIITIAFAVCLMLTLALYKFGDSRQTNNYLRGRYQVAFILQDDETIQAMKQHHNIESIGKKCELSTARINDYTLSIVYEDEISMDLLSATEFKGRMPEQINELIVEQAYLNYIGLDNTLEQKIKLDLGDGIEREYTVCGILQGENESRTYQIVSSLAYMESITANTPLYTALIRMKNSEKLSTDVLKDEIKDFANDFSISESNIFYSSTYFGLAEESSTTEIFVVMVASILITLACSLVIYSLFYISVIGKIKEYGRLRVIGTTKKQIKKMVRKEELLLSIIAIPLGLVMGCIIGYMLVPKGWYLSTTIICVFLIVFVIEIAISVAIHTPVNMAASVSPIEAIRVTSYIYMEDVRKPKKLNRNITPASFAWMNFVRNKKKVGLTLLSLGFTGVLLMCSSAYLNSIDVEEMAKQEFPNGAFNITLNANNINADTMVSAYTQLQEINSLDEELEDYILSIDGVKGIEKFTGCRSELQFPNNIDGRFRIIGLSDKQLVRYQTNMIEGTVDYDELVKNKGILVSDSENLIGTYYQYEAKLGDIIRITTEQGNTEEFTVMGILNNFATGIDTAFFYIPDDLLPDLKSNVKNFNTHFFVRSGLENINYIEEKIYEKTSQNPYLEVSELKDVINSLRQRLNAQKLPLYGLIFFIAIFGIINLINTLMTNMISRQQEFGILQSIGLSNQQLYMMLQKECLFYIFGTVIITLTIGTVCGIVLCTIFNQVGVFGRLTYHFPIIPLVIYFIALLLIQGIFSKVVIHFCEKNSLVERIKSIE